MAKVLTFTEFWYKFLLPLASCLLPLTFITPFASCLLPFALFILLPYSLKSHDLCYCLYVGINSRFNRGVAVLDGTIGVFETVAS